MRNERRARRPRGKGGEGKSASGGYMTPIPISSRVWIGIVVVGFGLFALLLYAAPTVPAVALGGGGAGHRALVSGAGPLALRAKGAGDPADRSGHARPYLSGFLLPRAAPDRAVEHPRKDHAPHRQQRQPALARRYKRAEREPAGTWL